MTAPIGNKKNIIMTKKTKNSEFPTTLFMISSVSALILAGVLYFIFVLGFSVSQEEPIQANNKQSDKYYLNESYQDTDPYVTKVPRLKDILAGPIIGSSDPSLGLKNSKVTIVEFSDFQCRFCQQQEQKLKRIVEKYKDQVRLIWKDYPESNKESLSRKAAVAARCAQEQGMFWPFHDSLYASMDTLDNDALFKIAAANNLNMGLFKQCLAGKAAAWLVDENIKEANALDINGVPFIYINEQEVMGEISLEDLERIVNIELEK